MRPTLERDRPNRCGGSRRGRHGIARNGPLALPSIQRSLKSDNPRVRIGAARAVAWLDSELQTATLSSLSELLGDPDTSVRWEVLQSLVRFGTTRPRPAVPAVMELLESDAADDRVRNLALWALKQIDPDVGIPPQQGDSRAGESNPDDTRSRSEEEISQTKEGRDQRGV